MTTDERIGFLQKTAYFEETPLEKLREVAPLMTECHLDPGETIIRKGSPGDSMYLIVSGSVRIHDGDHIFTRLYPKEGFGSYYLIDHLERSASVSAEEPTHLLRLSDGLFDKALKTDPSFTTGILRSLVKRLRQMNEIEEQLSALNATKDKFFSIIAHDLRAPLSTIIQFSGLLIDSRDQFTEDQVTDIIKSQYDASWSSLKLLDNLIKWAQLQTGRLQPVPVSFDLVQLVEELVEFSAPMAKAKGIAITFSHDTECSAFADQDMIRTLLVNLVNNAIKFSRKGGRIVISLESDVDLARIRITDQGVGMSPERLKQLFKPGRAISTDGTANEKGTGLGLILCRELAEKNNGTIEVSSKQDVGSVFTVTLPVHQS